MDRHPGTLIGNNAFVFYAIQAGEVAGAVQTLKSSPSRCHLGMLLTGTATVYLPEIGKKCVHAGEWFVVAMDGMPVRLEVSAEVRLVAVECDVVQFAPLANGLGGQEQSVLSCLTCVERKQPLFRQGRASATLVRLGQAFGGMSREGLAQRLAFESEVLKWLSLLLEHLETTHRPDCRRECKRVDETALRAAACYLEDCLADDHSISKLSRRVHLNEFKLKKGFRELFNTTVFGYLREKRMECAGQLLRSGAASVIEVANAVGYANPSHFARAFKQHHGMLPKTFQRLYAQ